MNLDQKVAIVTGANSGIGKETARGLAKAEATVVLACRDLDKAEAARREIQSSTHSERVSVQRLDLADTASILAFVKAFKDRFSRLDILVNNAGLMCRAKSKTAQGFETTFGVNYLGPFLLTRELVPLLEVSKPARVVVLASKLHFRGQLDFADLGFERRAFSASAAYDQSKLANVMFAKALARRLAGRGVTVNAVHPGVVSTEITRDYPKLLVKAFHLFTISPEKGALPALHLATAPEVETVTGAYFEHTKERPASKTACDEAAQERLWTVSDELLRSAGA
jgi:NAD(P)-dependent dehydrogenase (short-subunit alcohol dehydrogenase family)